MVWAFIAGGISVVFVQVAGHFIERKADLQVIESLAADRDHWRGKYERIQQQRGPNGRFLKEPEASL